MSGKLHAVRSQYPHARPYESESDRADRADCALRVARCDRELARAVALGASGATIDSLLDDRIEANRVRVRIL